MKSDAKVQKYFNNSSFKQVLHLKSYNVFENRNKNAFI